MPFEFASDIKHLHQATPLSLTGRSGVKLAWVENLKGSFDLESAYKLAMGSEEIAPFIASWIWKAPTFLASKLSYGNVLIIALLSKNVSQ